jgi:hypothetical protein
MMSKRIIISEMKNCKCDEGNDGLLSAVDITGN